MGALQISILSKLIFKVMKKQKVVISKRNLLNINLKTISKTALLIPSTIFTAWEVSEYGVFSGPYSVQIPENKVQKKLR